MNLNIKLMTDQENVLAQAVRQAAIDLNLEARLRRNMAEFSEHRIFGSPTLDEIVRQKAIKELQEGIDLGTASFLIDSFNEAMKAVDETKTQVNEKDFQLSLLTEPSYSGSRNINVTLIFENNSDNDCSVMNNLIMINGFLGPWFSIMDETHNREIPYKGPLKKHHPFQVLIRKHQSIFKEFNLSEVYDFPHTGNYSVKYEARYANIDCCKEEKNDDCYIHDLEFSTESKFTILEMSLKERDLLEASLKEQRLEANRLIDRLYPEDTSESEDNERAFNEFIRQLEAGEIEIGLPDEPSGADLDFSNFLLSELPKCPPTISLHIKDDKKHYASDWIGMGDDEEPPFTAMCVSKHDTSREAYRSEHLTDFQKEEVRFGGLLVSLMGANDICDQKGIIYIAKFLNFACETLCVSYDSNYKMLLHDLLGDKNQVMQIAVKVANIGECLEQLE